MESLKIIFQRVGPTITSQIKFWEKTRLKLDRTNNHVSFLTNCISHSIVPKGLQLPQRLQQPFLRTLLEETELKILKGQVSHLRKESSQLNAREIEACMNVAFSVSLEEFKVITARLNESTVKKNEHHTSTLSKKFNRLLHSTLHTQTIQERKKSEVVNLTKKTFDQETMNLLQQGTSFGIDTSQRHHLDNFVRLNAYSKNKQEISNKASITFDKFMESSTVKKHDKDIRLINKLKKDKDIKLTKADKGGKLVLMDTEDYDKKLDDYIQANFTKLDRNPTNKFQANLRSFLKNNLQWHQKKILKISPTYPKPPSIYGLPKIHKDGNPLRPIINQRNTVFSNISKVLAKGLFDVLPRPTSHIKNGKEFSSILRSTKLPTNYHIASIDIIDMYPSISPRAALKCLSQKLNQVPDPIFRETLQMEKEQALFLIQSILVSTYFEHKNEFYLQEKGLSMGSSLSPILADIYMDNLEQKILQKFGKQISFWKRYVDDTFVIWNSTLEELHEFLNWINGLDNNIKFTSEMELENGLPFLDTWVKRNGNNLVTVFYQKPTAGDSLLHFQSHHPIRLKINVAVQKLFKIQDLCTLNDDRMTCKRSLTADLKKLQYPPKVINQIFSSLRRRKLENKQGQKKQSYLPLYFEKTKQQDFQKIFNNQNNSVAWKQNNNILNIYKEAPKFSKNEEKKNVVYVIPCSCSKFYIGETSRPLKIRKKEHQNNVAVRDPDSHLASHVNSHPNHKILWDNTVIVEVEEDNILRKLKESSLITINRDQCISQPTIDVEHNWKWILEKYRTRKKIFNIELFIF